MLPKNNLPTLMGIDPIKDAAIADAFTDTLTPYENLARLSRYFLIKAFFTEPVFMIGKGDVTEYVFHSFFISTRNRFCYADRKNARRGWLFNHFDKIKRIEFTLKESSLEFKSYEHFKKKFDLRFITEDAIKDLWNSKSAQHGGKYKKSDFKGIGKVGKGLMRRFLQNFESIDKPKKEYPYHKSNCWEDQEVWVYSERYHTHHHSGRDISISHQSNAPYIFYSSEFQGCGNGTYGILANEKTYLWLEND